MLIPNKLLIASGVMIATGLAGITAYCFLLSAFYSKATTHWTEAELAALRSMRLPERWEILDHSNAYLNNRQAAQLGKLLFNDPGLSRSGQISCANCHQPQHYFTLPANSEFALDKQVPSLLGTASYSWFMLDGRADSLWAQALLPLEHHLEHGGTRTQYVQHVLKQYSQLYQAVFGDLPAALLTGRLPAQASPNSQDAAERKEWQQLDSQRQTAINRVFANIGKALAAFQATLWPQETRFDRYIDQVTGIPGTQNNATNSTLHRDEIAGLKIFISEQGQCLRCHNGPLLSNGSFHATTVPKPHPSGRQGRFAGIEKALSDPFNCLGDYSDSSPEQCKELLFSKKGSDELKGATKVPTLRNIGKTAPYMHAGQFETLHEVLSYYNRAAAPFGTHSDLNPLKLLPYQIRQLEAFLLTLTEDDPGKSAR